MSGHTDWVTIARAKTPPMPDEAVARIAPAVESLLASFRPLLAELEHTTEPAITLSETAVLGEGTPRK